MDEAVIAELREREKALATELKSAESPSVPGSDAEAEVAAALSFADRLSELASNGENFAVAREAFAVANAKLFVKFKPVRKKRRTLNQISGGVVTLGTAPPPVDLYNGPHGAGIRSKKRARGLLWRPTGLVSDVRPQHRKSRTPVGRKRR